MAIPNIGAYSSTKRALTGISLTARGELEKDNIVVSTVYPYITDTEFFKNTMRNDNEQFIPSAHGRAEPPDTPEYVAELILKAVKSGEAELYARDWAQGRR